MPLSLHRTEIPLDIFRGLLSRTNELVNLADYEIQFQDTGFSQFSDQLQFFYFHFPEWYSL
jgi:hypothetical protein